MTQLSLSRRTVLSGLAASLTLAACEETPLGKHTAAPQSLDVGLYVTLFDDGRMTFVTPNAEMGQGTYDALARMIAEEMDISWNSVSIALSGENAAMKNRSSLARSRATVRLCAAMVRYCARLARPFAS